MLLLQATCSAWFAPTEPLDRLATILKTVKVDFAPIFVAPTVLSDRPAVMHVKTASLALPTFARIVPLDPNVTTGSIAVAHTAVQTGLVPLEPLDLPAVIQGIAQLTFVLIAFVRKDPLDPNVVLAGIAATIFVLTGFVRMDQWDQPVSLTNIVILVLFLHASTTFARMDPLDPHVTFQKIA